MPNEKLTFLYPRSHYLHRPVPTEVSATSSEPLDIDRIKEFDGFIITSAPIDHLAFHDVEYIEEIRCLIQELDKQRKQQLYFCWGAMAAMNYFYGIRKRILAEKIFGIFPHLIIEPHPLLDGLSQGFIAPPCSLCENG